jgi:hypothetical protein
VAGNTNSDDSSMKILIQKIKVAIKLSKKYRSGISIFEIILAVAIAAGIFVAVTSIQANLNLLQNLVNQRLQSPQDIKQTMQILTTEIRSAGPSSLGAYPIEATATGTFTFYSDIDKDGFFEKIRYFLSSASSTNVIKKGVIKPAGNPLIYSTSSEIITTAIANVVPSKITPLFQYFDSSYTGTEPPLSAPIDPIAVRVIQFTVYADINPSQTPKPEFFMTTITVRNIRSN